PAPRSQRPGDERPRVPSWVGTPRLSMQEPRYEETVETPRWLVAAVGLAAVVAASCSRLRIRVDSEALRFRFGPFGRTLKAADIRAAGVEPYRVWSLGGWGW